MSTFANPSLSVNTTPSRRIVRAALTALTLLALSFGAGQAALAAAPGPDEVKPAAEGVVNINTATPDQLGYLPGIGPAKAQRIVEYRAKRPFARPVELARVRGIGLKTVRKLQPWLTVKGQTTLEAPVGGKKKKARGDKPRTAKAPGHG